MGRQVDTILSWNVRGLHDPRKRTALFSFFLQKNPTIICLQESHLTVDTTHLLSMTKYPVQYHSVHTRYSRGVSILFSRNTAFIKQDSLVDPEGRFIFLMGKWESRLCVIANIYIPPPFTLTVLQCLARFMAKHPQLPVYVLGDLNSAMDISLDIYKKFSPQGHREYTLLSRFVTELGLVDLWRCKNPLHAQFSCHSLTHSTLSRIDFALGNDLTLSFDPVVTYLARGLSDHSPVQLSLDLRKTCLPMYWKLNPFWFQLFTDLGDMRTQVQYFLDDNKSSAAPGVIWDTLKAFIRGMCIKEISLIKTRNRQWAYEAERVVEKAEELYLQDPTPEQEGKWKDAQKIYRTIHLQQADNKRFFTSQTYFEEGEKTGHMLAMIAKSQQPSQLVHSIRTSTQSTVTDTPSILKEFYSFYQDLYSSKVIYPMDDLVRFLDSITLPCLEEMDRERLNAPFSLEEFQNALATFPNSKAPGNDGLPVELYKKFCGVLLPELLHTLKNAFDLGSLPRSMYEAVVVVILKPGKDPEKTDSYRPISLLNTDLKILTKVIAMRLSAVVTALVHPDQSGFIPNRSTANNLRRLFLNMQIPTDNYGHRAILSLDAAKAFDSVEWEYLWKVLEKFKLGEDIISWIKLLYKAPKACIRINNTLSPPFDLYRGTRQGCPLSPLLFALAIEPLAAAIRGNPEIQGFRRGELEDKLALYADDALLFLGDTSASLIHLMELVYTFGTFSGFKINWDKSTLLPLDPLSGPLPQIADQIKVVDKFKYLGIMVHSNLDQYIKLNVEPVLKKFQEKTTSWNKLPLSVVGRCNLIKMIWNPQLLYVLHNAPVWIPAKVFKKCNTIYRALIWRKLVPRIKLETLQERKDLGGLAVPNPFFYFVAAQLQHLAGWLCPEPLDPTRNMVGARVSGDNLVECIEAGELGAMDQYPTLILIDKIWNKTKQLLQYTGYNSWSRIWRNSNYPELNKLQGFIDWERWGIKYISQLYDGGVFREFQSLRAEFALPNTFFFQYLQLRHAISVQAKTSTWELTRPIMLMKLTMTPSRKGQISSVYSTLLGHVSMAMTLKCRTGWGEDIGDINDKEWNTILGNVPSVTLSSTQQLTQLFIIHRTYYTPEKLYKWRRRDDPFCPRCLVDNGTLIHMLWRCPKLQRYWGAVVDTVNSIWNLQLPMDPKSCLLGCLDEERYMPDTYTAILRTLFLARKLIAKKWLSVTAPTYTEWIISVNDSLVREQLTYKHRGKMGKFENIWGPWLDTPGLATLRLTQDRNSGDRDVEAISRRRNNR